MVQINFKQGWIYIYIYTFFVIKKKKKGGIGGEGGNHMCPNKGGHQHTHLRGLEDLNPRPKSYWPNGEYT